MNTKKLLCLALLFGAAYTHAQEREVAPPTRIGVIPRCAEGLEIGTVCRWLTPQKAKHVDVPILLELQSLDGVLEQRHATIILYETSPEISFRQVVWSVIVTAHYGSNGCSPAPPLMYLGQGTASSSCQPQE